MYAEAVLKAGNQRSLRPAVKPRPAARANASSMPPVAVGANSVLASMDWSGMVAAIDDRDGYVRSVAVEATPAMPSIDWSGMVASIEDREMYLSGTATPNEDGSM